jgi:hypothetical protein
MHLKSGLMKGVAFGWSGLIIWVLLYFNVFTWIRNDFFCFKVRFIITCNIEWVHSMLCLLFICSFSFLAEAKCLFWVSSLKGMDLYFFFYIGLKENQLQRCYSCVLSVISTDFGRIFRNMDYWIELKRLLFKFFRITQFRIRSDKSIWSSILSKLKN